MSSVPLSPNPQPTRTETTLALKMRAAIRANDLDAWTKHFSTLVQLKHNTPTNPLPATHRLLSLDKTPHAPREALLAELAQESTRGHAAEIHRLFGLDDVSTCLLAALRFGQLDPANPNGVTLAWVLRLLFGEPGPLWGLGRLRLHPMAPLRKFGLVIPSLERGWTDPSCGLSLSDSLVLALDGHCVPDPELAIIARWLPPNAAPGPGHDPAFLDTLAPMLAPNPTDGPRVILVCGGDEGVPTLEAVASRVSRTLLVVDGAAVVAHHRDERGGLVTAAIREARLHNAILNFDMTGVHDEDSAVFAEICGHLNRFSDPCVLTLTPSQPEHTARLDGRVFLTAPAATPDQRAEIWSDALSQTDIALTHREIASLAVGHTLGRRAIQDAVANAHHHSKAPKTSESASLMALLQREATRQTRQGMAGLAEPMATTQSWGDIVLPNDTLESLMEVLTFARYRQQVFDDWGFRQKLPYGRALSALMHGPPGTGKTLVAGILARDLGKPLFRVDLSQIVSKYIGETEKKLAQVFDEASRSGAVLLFDEADSLFGKRTEVKSSTDRYANMNVNFLLQAMESFEGVVLMTTNLDSAIDDAFKRRIRFHIAFPFPDAPLRAQLWDNLLPPGVPRAQTIDFPLLGREFEISGGHIKDAVLRAAFMAAERGSEVTTDLLFDAGRRVYREMGRLIAA